MFPQATLQSAVDGVSGARSTLSLLVLLFFGAVFERPLLGLMYEFGLALVHVSGVLLLFPALARSGTYFLCASIKDLPILLFAHLLPSITNCPSSNSIALLSTVLRRMLSTTLRKLNVYVSRPQYCFSSF